LVFLIVVIVAAAVLIAWLLVPLARGALGDLRFSRLREGEFQSAPSAGPALDALARNPPDGNRADPDRGHTGPEPAGRGGTREESREDLVLYDETDAEMAVRDRLYGRHGHRA
jgi:hypothetical protein